MMKLIKDIIKIEDYYLAKKMLDKEMVVFKMEGKEWSNQN